MQHTFPISSSCESHDVRPRIEFSNHYMFERIMQDETICRGVLETILGFPIGRINYLNAEQVLEPGLNCRGVQLDIYAEDDSCVYDIEIQCRPEPVLEKRFRYYQSAIDSGLLAKGADFDELPESYVIFLCTNDPLQAGLPMYTLDRICLENTDVPFRGSSHWLVLNTTAWSCVHDEELRNLLRYIEDGSVGGDGFMQRIDDAVTEANDDSRWVSKVWSVSTIEENEARRNRILRRQAEAEGRAEGLAEGRTEGLAKGLAEGRAEGRIEGEDRYNNLAKKLLLSNRISDLKKATEDPTYRESLFAEFGI